MLQAKWLSILNSSFYSNYCHIFFFSVFLFLSVFWQLEGSSTVELSPIILVGICFILAFLLFACAVFLVPMSSGKIIIITKLVYFSISQYTLLRHSIFQYTSVYFVRLLIIMCTCIFTEFDVFECVKQSLLFVLFLSGTSPILRTLTESISTDSLSVLTVSLYTSNTMV